MLGTPKKCAKCDKQVYPIEELKCLDKVWHKICFKCTVCNSMLNMKNYKGFEKMPYCNVHYPQQKHTAVNDNPELLRIKENTKIQSNAKYHEDFEKSKGNYTVVADDPETRRILENTKIISQVKYHEDFEKNIKNKYTPVIDSPETTRAIENQKLVSSAEYKGIKNQNSTSSLTNTNANSNQNSLNNNTSNNTTTTNNNNNNTNNLNNIHTNHPNTTLIATFRAGEKKVESQTKRQIGSIADYDPLNLENRNENGNGNSNGTHNNNILNKQYSYVKQQQQQSTNGNGASNGHTNNGVNNSPNGNKVYNNGKNGTTSNQYYENGTNDNNNNNSLYNNKQQQLQQQLQYDFMNDIKTTVYKAIYDYDAKEDDEISFRDGDKFINCEQIDIGWMIGVHEKTGKHGMFPSNYAEPIDLF